MSRRYGPSLTRLIVAVLAHVSLAPSATAQQRPELIDQIVAVVADTAVLQSELEEQLFRLQTQGVQVPDDPNQLHEFMRQVLEQKVNEVLLVIHARKAGISVSEQEINEVVDQRVSQIRGQFQSEVQYQQALQQAGMTAAEFRIQMAEQTRAELLTQRYLQQRVSDLQPVPVSEEEIREQFEAQRASMGSKPATITLKQIVVTPSASEDAELVAQERAERVLSRARAGEDFAKLARQYSEDSATRSQGGELGWLRKGQLLPEFERALFNLKAGQISEIVRTAVGYHVIKLERIRGAERFARHILIRPEIGEADVERARKTARDVTEALRSGGDPDSLATAYGDPSERTALTEFPREQLPEAYAQALADARPGDVVGPFNVPAPSLESGKFVVVKVLDTTGGGDWTLEDVRPQIRQQVQRDRMLSKVVDNLRESTYIETREDALNSMVASLVDRASTLVQ